MAAKFDDAPPRGPLAVLVADDDKAVRALVAFHLRGLDLDLEFAVDVAGAVAACGRRAFDLALVDLLMPGGGGASVPRRVADAGGRAPDVVLALSASCTNAGFTPPEGFHGAVAKPFTSDSLLKALRTHLPGWGPDKAAGGAAGAGPKGCDPALAHLLPKVRRSMAGDAQGIGRALDAGDLAAAGDAAHTLRGTAGCYGFAEVETAAQDLERAARAGDQASAREAFARVRMHLDQSD